jgi:hypothetical protein
MSTAATIPTLQIARGTSPHNPEKLKGKVLAKAGISIASYLERITRTVEAMERRDPIWPARQDLNLQPPDSKSGDLSS